MDPNNPIVLLCVSGIQAEQQGRMADAHRPLEDMTRKGIASALERVGFPPCA